MKPHILIVEDEEDLLSTLHYNFSKENYRVTETSSGKAAIKIIDKDASLDIVILDVMLPDISGLDVCKHIKLNPKNKHILVIMLTAKGEEIDRIVGFELGADDYVVKPFSLRELTLRVSSLLKRNQSVESNEKITFGDINIDLDSHKVSIKDKTIELTIKEFKLLHYLVKNHDKVQTREVLLRKVWGYNTDITTRTVDTHIKRLRPKLGLSSTTIKTIRSVGYKITNKNKK